MDPIRPRSQHGRTDLPGHTNPPPDARAITKHNAAEAASHAAELALHSSRGLLGVAGAVAGPLVSYATSLHELAAAQMKGMQMSAALQREVERHVTLSFGRPYLGEAYSKAASRALGHDYNDSQRALITATASRVHSALIKASGGSMATAQARCTAGIKEGEAYARALGLKNPDELTRALEGSEAFRKRYNSDAAFYHGVNKAVLIRG